MSKLATGSYIIDRTEISLLLSFNYNSRTYLRKLQILQPRWRTWKFESYRTSDRPRFRRVIGAIGLRKINPFRVLILDIVIRDKTHSDDKTRNVKVHFFMWHAKNKRPILINALYATGDLIYPQRAMQVTTLKVKYRM